eukprot:3635707-Pleurochrysis_carterae.AAC.2
MAETRQVTHRNRQNADMYNRPRVVKECNGVGSAQPQQVVQVVMLVVIMREPLYAFLDVVHNVQTPGILHQL